MSCIGMMISSLLLSSTNCRFSCFQIVFEDVFPAYNLVTLEHLKELSSKRKAIEDSINESSFITEAIAKEMSGGLESRYEQVTVYAVLSLSAPYHHFSVHSMQKSVSSLCPFTLI